VGRGQGPEDELMVDGRWLGVRDWGLGLGGEKRSPRPDFVWPRDDKGGVLGNDKGQNPDDNGGVAASDDRGE